MRETTSTEFVEWHDYFEQDLELPTREEYYLMQVAAEIRRANAKNPRTVKLEHLQLRLKIEDDTPLSDEAREQYTKQSKAGWLALVMQPKSPPPQKGIS